MVGKLYIDSDNIHVEGNPDPVSGSKTVAGRDPSEIVNWWGVEQPTAIPTIPRDSAGRLMRLCSNGHYAQIEKFGKDKREPDKKDRYCKDCRKVQNNNWKRTG